MTVELSSLDKLTVWEDYCAFLKDRLNKLSGSPEPFLVSKKKLDFSDGKKGFKAHAVLAGAKGAQVAKALTKEGVQFHEGTCTADGKELAVEGVDGGILKEAARTLTRTKLGFKLAGVEEGEEGGADAGTDPKALKERLAKLETQLSRTIDTEETEHFLAQARKSAKAAAGVLETSVDKFLELIEEAEEFARQALAGVLEGGDPTAAMQLEKERKELLEELDEARKLGEPANDAFVKQTEKALEGALAAIGKKDLDKARGFLDAAEAMLSLLVEGGEETGDPDLTVLDDWKKYRSFLKVQLKKVPKEGGPFFVSKQPQVFTIKGKEFKGHAILFGGPKARAAMLALKREGMQFMEGTLKADGTALKVSALKRSLFKGAVKTMRKLRLGRKLVVEGTFEPEDDATAEGATDGTAGKASLDKQIKECAEGLIKLREGIETQRKGVPALKKIADDKKTEHEKLVIAAQKKQDATGAADAEWEAADLAKNAADAAAFEVKNADKAAGRAENDLREMTERLHRIKGSNDAVATKQTQLKKLKSDIAAKQLDTQIANIDPKDPKAGKLIADQIEKRFGVKFKLNESTITVDAKGKQVHHDNAKKLDPAKEAESLKELYLTLAKAPVFPSSHLKKLTVSMRPATANSEGGVYYGDSLKAEITCRRPKESFNYGDQLASPDYFPDGVDPDCQPANADPVNYFDWATLHEVAHAVDAKHNFMNSRLKNAKYGNWNDHGQNVAPIATAVSDEFGKSLDANGKKKLREYAMRALQANPGGGPAPKTPEETAVKDWVDAVRAPEGLWWDGAGSNARKIGGRIYHESYEGGWWISYDAAARKQGIHGYQFRAPGEWFAELYAAYYSDKLKPSHPIVPDLTQLEVPKK